MVNVMQVVQYIQTREENSTLVDQHITSMLISTYKMHIINMVEKLLNSKFQKLQIVYNSIKEASEKTKVKYNTIQKRLKNPNFPNYFYIKYPNKNVDI